VIGLTTVILYHQWRPERVETPPPLTIDQIRLLQQLVTAKLVVTELVTTTSAGHTGSMVVVVAAKGELVLGVDLQDAELVNVNQASRQATLVLPAPRLLDVHVDHGHSRVLMISSHGLWQLLPADSAIDARLIDRAYAAAEQQLQTLQVPADALQRARRQAETVLQAFVGRLGWTLKFRWQAVAGPAVS